MRHAAVQVEEESVEVCRIGGEFDLVAELIVEVDRRKCVAVVEQALGAARGGGRVPRRDQRTLRLLIPTTWYVAAALAAAAIAIDAGAPASDLSIAGWAIALHLWFLPVYLILNRLHWIDTPLALIVPEGAGAFGVFLE